MGEMKKVKVNFTLDPFAEMKPQRKKKILENKRIMDAIKKMPVEYKETIVVDAKKWDAKKLETALQNAVAIMELKMFDTVCGDLDSKTPDKKLEDEIIKSYKSLMKRIQKNVDEQMDTVINDKPDDTKLKKGVDALAKVDPNAAKSAYADYNKWMKRCEKNWGNIEKLEAGMKQHGADMQKLSNEAAGHEKKAKGGDGASESKAGAAKDGADKKKQIVDTLTQKRDALLTETKSLYKEETDRLLKSLEAAVQQMGGVVSFAGEMKRSQQISDDAQKALQSGKGYFKMVEGQDAELKKLRRTFDSMMTKLERAKNAGGRPNHAQLLIPQDVVKDFEKLSRQSTDMHKTLKSLYKAAK